MQRRYVTLDVFTDQAFGGNPLAVVLDAEGLSDARMQAIATEFNYSETTFVLPPREPGHDAWVRIFTPRAELPFAGHPNVGTAVAVARERGLASGTLRFEEGAGLVVLSVTGKNGVAAEAEFTAPQPFRRGETGTREAIAECVSLPAGSIVEAAHPPVVASVGLDFVVAEVADPAALREAVPNVAAFRRVLPMGRAEAIYLYARAAAADGATCDIRARMFAPLDNILEDPATGSATAAAAGLLASLAPEPALERRLVFLQGVEMGRPSRLVATVSKRAGQIETVRVAGACVEVMRGSLVAV